MKLYSDIINKDFDEKVKEVDTLEEDLEQSLILVEFLPNLSSLASTCLFYDLVELLQSFYQNSVEKKFGYQ